MFIFALELISFVQLFVFLVDGPCDDNYNAAQYLKLLGGVFKSRGATKAEFEGLFNFFKYYFKIEI